MSSTHATDSSGRHQNGKTALEAAQSEHADWGYEGAISPEHWGDLCPAYHMANEGEKQSPIDIPSSAPLNPSDLAFDYKPSALHIANNGHTIQADYDDGSYLRVDGMAYKLIQFHFHNPSETTVDGQATPMEIHLVHKNEHGEIAVVGGFIVQGSASEAYASVFDNMPAAVDEPIEVPGVSVNAADLLPADQRYWRYDGSLTTPPCTEGVKWFMLKTPIEASPDQIETFKALYTGNARPVQPMNERTFIIGQVPQPAPKVAERSALSYAAKFVKLALALVVIAVIAHLIFHRDDE